MKESLTKDKILDYLDLTEEIQNMCHSFSLNKKDSSIASSSDESESSETTLEEPDYSGMTEDEKIIAQREYREKKKELREKQLEKKTEKIKSEADEGINNISNNIKTIGEFSGKLVSKSSDLNELGKLLDEVPKSELETNPDLAELNRQYKISKLEIKKSEVLVKKRTNELKIQMLESMINGKMSKASESINGAAVNGMKKTSEVTDKINEGLDKVVELIPQNFKIDGEGMSFFITPKTMTSGTNIPIVNTNESMGDYINDGVKLAIDEMMQSPKVANIASKTVYVGKNISEAVSGGLVKEKDASMNEDIDVSVGQATKVLYEAADKIINLLPEAQPMPKYEKLSPINIGYMSFLTTGWCNAGHTAFGLPM